LYIAEQKAGPEIVELLNLPSINIVYWALNKYHIRRRTVSEACRLPGKIKRYKNTCLKIYGAENTFCKESSNRKKWEARLLKEEGITNVFQRESVKRKSIETLIAKYNVYNAGLLPKTGKTFSKIHKLVVDYLTQNNIKCIIEKKLLRTNGRNKFSNYYYSYDISIGGTNKLIEVNGDFWHANPRIYSPSDRVICGSYRPLAKEVWEKDKEKNKFRI